MANPSSYTIYGQPSVTSIPETGKVIVVQDQILIVQVGNATSQSENHVIIISDVWENLKSGNTQPVAIQNPNRPNYWYWEIDSTSIDPDKEGRIVKFKLECPKPGPEVFDNNFEIEGTDSDWTKYWKEKMAEAENSKENSVNAVFSEEVTLKGTSYIRWNDDKVTIEDKVIRRSDDPTNDNNDNLLLWS